MSGRYYYEVNRGDVKFHKDFMSNTMSRFLGVDYTPREHKQGRLFAVSQFPVVALTKWKPVSQREYEKRTGQQGWIIGAKR